MKDKISRAFINQPSANQPLHKLHGKWCVVEDTGKKTVTIYFTEGEVHSMVVPRLCLDIIKV